MVARRGLLDLMVHLIPIAADREAERARDAAEVAQPGWWMAQGRRPRPRLTAAPQPLCWGYARGMLPPREVTSRGGIARWLATRAQRSLLLDTRRQAAEGCELWHCQDGTLTLLLRLLIVPFFPSAIQFP